jgi:uncharacterized phage infection (PIP) family protein YhgE
MQTQPYAPPLPQAPELRPRSRTNWVATVVAGGLGLLVAIALIVVLSSRTSELARTQKSLRSANATVSSQASELDSQASDLDRARADLSSATDSLSSTRSDLDTANNALDLTFRCATATLDAWYSTTNDSYTVTGYALETAVDSPACRAVHGTQVGDSGSYA